MDKLIAVFLGGGLGSVCRYGLSLWLNKQENSLPIGTILANIMACLILGYTAAFFMEKTEHAVWAIALTVGFCGGFSTFSTFTGETVKMINQGKWEMVALNVIVSLVVCVLAYFGGVKLFALTR